MINKQFDFKMAQHLTMILRMLFMLNLYQCATILTAASGQRIDILNIGNLGLNGAIVRS